MKLLEKGILVFAIFLFVVFGYFSFFNVYQADDYIFSYFTRKFGFFGAVADLYFHWGGRYFGYSLNLLNPVEFDPHQILPKVYPMLLMISFIAVVAINFGEFLKTSLYDSVKKAFLFFFFYTILLVNLSEHYFWVTGATVYFLPVIFSGLLLFSLYRFHKSEQKTWLYISLILIVLTVGNNEIIALILEGLLVANFIYRKSRINLLLFTVSTICLMISFLAPGNFNRMGETTDAFWMLWLKRFAFFAANLFHLTLKTVLILPLFLKIFEKDIEKVISNFDRKKVLVIWGIFFVPVVFLSFLLNGTGRQFENVLTFYFILSSCLIVFQKINLKRFWWISILVLMLPKFHILPMKQSVFVFNFNVNDAVADLFNTDLKKYEAEINSRIDLIKTSKSDSVLVPKIAEVPRILFFDELSSVNEPKKYTNDQLEKYFNKKSVVAEK